MSNNKTFKVSQLTQISNIDDSDLLLVSDYDSGKCITKKMTMKQVSTFVSNAVKPAIVQIVNQAVQDALSGDIQQMIVDAVDAAMSGPFLLMETQSMSLDIISHLIDLKTIVGL